jgi:hypothetical protein
MRGIEISLSGALFLSSFVLVPAALLAFIRPAGRRIFLVVGLAFGFGVGLFVNLGGPDSPALIIPLFGFGVAAGAIIVEVGAFIIGMIQRLSER